MANVRCPMCSETNDADVEVCAFCGARLKPLRPSSLTPEEGGLSGGQEDDEPAWLRELRSDDQQPGEVSQEPAAGAEKSEVPDWLNRIREKAREETGPDPEKPGGEDEAQPDWLSDFQMEVGASGDAGPEGDDWLGRIRPSDEAQAETGAGVDWANIPDSAPAQPEPLTGDLETGGFGLTGFLAGLERAESGQGESPTEQPDQEIPAWDLPVEDKAGFELPGWQQSEQGAVESLPDWLSEPELEASTAPDGQEDLPDWLNSLVPAEPGEQEPAPGPIPAGQAEGEPAELPDWFTGIADLDQESQGEQPAASLEEPGPFEPGLPGWLAGQEEPVTETGEAYPEGLLPGEVAQEEPILADLAAELPVLDEGIPDWLRDMPGQPAEMQADFLPPTIPLAPGEGEDLTQLAGMETDQLFLSDELPGWLSESAEENAAEAPEPLIEQPAGEALTAAELPDWVREMRPIESVDLGEPVAPEVDQRIERAGPLAGLRGILQAEDTATRYRKPPVYSARLRVSEKQRIQASLLESILEQETQPLLIPPARSRAPRLVGRILIALLWLAVMAIAFVFPLRAEPPLMRTPPELEEMFNQIDQSVQTDRPVLLAIDYEPALAGEMTLAAQPVVEHLISRNARIVIVSTTPAGPLLAQSLLDGAMQKLAGQAQSYDVLANTVNLGYLPGGTISLLEFTWLPRQAAPASVAGDYTVWDQPVLAPVKSLKDFAQIIVVTDSAEVGRNWVEQVKPLMGDVPLLMVASAQAEPLLMPYIDSGQINGLTGGLLGGILYNQWRQVEPAAGVYWTAYQVGIGLAFVLVLVGGLVSAGAALLKRGDKDEAS